MFKKKLLPIALAAILSVQGVFTGTIQAAKYDDDRYHDEYSKASIITDKDTGRIIYSKNADEKRPMASMTKIMTLLLTFDAIKAKKVSYNDMVKIEEEDVDRLGTNIRLVEGEEISLKDLLDSLMIVSANDSALAIARYVGGSEEKFVENMNKKAKEVGMKDTTFYNPNGLPIFENTGEVTENTTTAEDVLQLVKWMYKHYPKETTAITSQKRLELEDRQVSRPNTNPLLTMYDNVDGVKTGFTTAAGYCLAYSMKMPAGDGNDVANRLFGVTMGAQSKYARKLAASGAIDFINEKFRTKRFVEKGKDLEEVYINGSKSLKNQLVAKKSLVIMQREGEEYNGRIEQKNEKLKEDNPVAEYVLENGDGKEVARLPLYLKTPLKDFSIGMKLKYHLSGIKAKLKGIPTITNQVN